MTDLTENAHTQEKNTAKRSLENDEEAPKLKKTRFEEHPRWHNQAYMLFLALRQHPDQCLPRRALIQEALKLDQKISKELNLPHVFRGKTPANSASASLTNNSDRYFIPFWPDGPRPTWFKLAYEPGNEKKAVQEYRKWLTKLAEHDWPYCFGVPKVNKKPVEIYQTPPASETDECIDTKTAILSEPVQELSPESIHPENDEKLLNLHEIKEKETIETTKQEITELETTEQGITTNIIKNKVSEKNVAEKEITEKDNHKKESIENGAKDGNSLMSSLDISNKMEEIPVYTLDELDLTNVPKSLDDIVYSAPSRIPGAGSGLFAKRKLPYNTPIGFYFGVPMTEDEFDSLKDRVGRSSEYSIMYRKTVLDATDKDGEPVKDEKNLRYCPFHFMNETDAEKANILFVEGIVVNQVICWTKCDIEAGEELFAWYGKDVDRHWNSKGSKKNEQCNST